MLIFVEDFRLSVHKIDCYAILFFGDVSAYFWYQGNTGLRMNCLRFKERRETDSARWTNEGAVATTLVDMTNVQLKVMIMRVEMWKEDVNIQYQEKKLNFFLVIKGELCM